MDRNSLGERWMSEVSARILYESKRAGTHVQSDFCQCAWIGTHRIEQILQELAPKSCPAKPWYKCIQWFNPWDTLYVGVQFGNCTWFLFQVRRAKEPG